jgi:DNA-binding transcriptional MerR regulator
MTPDEALPDSEALEDPESRSDASPDAPARYSIGEVGERLDLESHVLRYWESEFDLLDPEKDAAGRRVYGEADVRAVQRIQHLLKVEMYTIAGARRVLDREGIDGRDAYRSELQSLRSFLVDVRDRLSKETDSS